MFLTDEKKWLLKLAELFPDVCKHVMAGRRSPEQVRLLLEAMQLFHNDRLGAVMSTESVKKLTRENVFAFCDMTVVEAGFPDDVQTVLLEHGIRLCGELFRFWWSPEGKVGATVRAHMTQYGLPFQFDPWHYGWRPAYLQNPAVLAALQASIATVCKLPSVWQPYPCFLNGGGTSLGKEEQYVGAYLARPFGVDRSVDSRLAQCKERHGYVSAAFSVLHGAMYFEACWPEGWCPELTAYNAVCGRAKLLRDRLGALSYKRSHEIERERGSEALVAKRRAALVTALRAENMSPHFFHEVVMSYSQGSSRYDRIGGGVETVRALLCSSQKDVEGSAAEPGNGHYVLSVMRTYLRHWGLDFMKPEEFDAIFGKNA